MSILVQLVVTFGLLSLLSIGGANATLPEIHRQVVGQLHWMNDQTFATLVAIGQTAPGPNVLIVSMIGWHMDGVAGMLAATLAIVLPSAALALVISRLMTRFSALAWIALARRALAPIAVGFILASGAVMTQATYQGGLSLAIVAAVGLLVTVTSISPFWGILGGAVVGIAGHGLNLFH